VDTVVLPAMRGTLERSTLAGDESDWLEARLKGRSARLVVGFLIVYGMMSAFATEWRIQQDFTLQAADEKALSWLQTNTPDGARFAAVTGELPLRDATSEWLPALTHRQSVATVFGFEWIRSTDFSHRVELYRDLQACRQHGPASLQEWAQEYDLRYDYVYLRSPAGVDTMPLGVLLDTSADYEIVYSSPTVRIYHQSAADHAMAP
jgi:hypothetical protein